MPDDMPNTPSSNLTNQAQDASPAQPVGVSTVSTQPQTSAQTSYVDGYQPPANPPQVNQAQPQPEPEVEVNPEDAEAALNQVLKQLNEEEETPAEDSADQQAQAQPQATYQPESTPKDSPAPSVQQPPSESNSQVPPSAAAATQQPAPVDQAQVNRKPQSTNEVDAAEVEKARQTLEEILAEIEAKKAQSSPAPSGQVKSNSSAGSSDTTVNTPSGDVSSAQSTTSQQVTSEEARKAREELARILEEIEKERQRLGSESDSTPVTDSTVGASSDSSVGAPAQPTVPPVGSRGQVDEQGLKTPQSVPQDNDQPRQLMDFEAEDDLPVKADEVKKIHDEVVKAEEGKLDPSVSPKPPAPAKPSTTASAGTPDTVAVNTTTGPSEKLDDQNIFFMLGVKDASEKEKESFLDELQQVVWEDFLENDVKLLLTEEEYKKLQEMLQARPNASFAEQGEIIDYLEKLIPDLEEIMVEKAMELKADMFKERLADLKAKYKDAPEKLTKVEEAEKLMHAGKWYSASLTLNSLES